MLNLFCLCSINRTTKAGWQHSCSQHSLLDTYCSGKKIPFKILLFLDILSGHPWALMEMCNEIWVVFLPVNRISVLRRMDKEKISPFKSFYLRNTVFKLPTGYNTSHYCPLWTTALARKLACIISSLLTTLSLFPSYRWGCWGSALICIFKKWTKWWYIQMG